MQPETYTLMHRMYCAASSKNEIEIVLRRFKEIFDSTKDSGKPDDQFDAAWATVMYRWFVRKLREPYLAEQTYREAIKLFDKSGMAINAATICVALGKFFWEMEERRSSRQCSNKTSSISFDTGEPATRMCSQQKKS